MMKSIIEALIALISLIMFLPVLIIVSLMIRIKLGSPIIFSQVRPGLDAKPFVMYKFRTMKDVRDEQGDLLPDELRMTSLGAFLRNSSIDELPELINIIKGEMSFIGPRPLLMSYVPLYNDYQKRRHEVKPGITGWAQINGRNAINWNDKFKLDVWYVDNRSFWLDAKILFLTIKKVFAKEGISSEGHVTTPPFTGNSRKDIDNG